MDYFLFMGQRLARRINSFEYEWFVNGEWKENTKRSRALQDAMNGFGDYSIGDYDQITEEMATQLMQNGTIVLQGNIGFGTTYHEPVTVQLADWVKSGKQ